MTSTPCRRASACASQANRGDLLDGSFRRCCTSRRGSLDRCGCGLGACGELFCVLESERAPGVLDGGLDQGVCAFAVLTGERTGAASDVRLGPAVITGFRGTSRPVGSDTGVGRGRRSGLSAGTRPPRWLDVSVAGFDDWFPLRGASGEPAGFAVAEVGPATGSAVPAVGPPAVFWIAVPGSSTGCGVFVPGPSAAGSRPNDAAGCCNAAAGGYGVPMLLPRTVAGRSSVARATRLPPRKSA